MVLLPVVWSLLVGPVLGVAEVLWHYTHQRCRQFQCQLTDPVPFQFMIRFTLLHDLSMSHTSGQGLQSDWGISAQSDLCLKGVTSRLPEKVTWSMTRSLPVTTRWAVRVKQTAPAEQTQPTGPTSLSSVNCPETALQEHARPARYNRVRRQKKITMV